MAAAVAAWAAAGADVVARAAKGSSVTLRNDRRLAFAGVLACALALCAALACTRPPPGTFATPEEAMQAIADLAGTGDKQKTEEIFTASGVELLSSGDPENDREDALKVKALIQQKVAFEDFDGGKIALIGDDAWPFPIPLVQQEERWRFDTDAGREELLNRRIGRNELLAIASLHAYVDAQREYFAQGRDGNPPAFARKFVSGEGLHDGLYWPASDGEVESPIGPLLADADIERREATAGADPFNGYYFRILESQGADAPGGARSYLDAAGVMTAGFAAIAWPAKHGNSGVMTFLVGQQGIVFQRDLGADTDGAVAAITTYDPDSSWNPTPD